jgi:hypothetical protein
VGPLTTQMLDLFCVPLSCLITLDLRPRLYRGVVRKHRHRRLPERAAPEVAHLICELDVGSNLTRVRDVQHNRELAGQGWVKMRPSGTSWSGCLLRHSPITPGRKGILAPRMNVSSAA